MTDRDDQYSSGRGLLEHFWSFQSDVEIIHTFEHDESSRRFFSFFFVQEKNDHFKRCFFRFFFVHVFSILQHWLESKPVRCKCSCSCFNCAFRAFPPIMSRFLSLISTGWRPPRWISCWRICSFEFPETGALHGL